MGYFIRNTDDCSFLIDDQDFIGRTVQECGKWEPHIESVFKRLVRPGYLALNIGANMGYHTIKLATVAKSVVAFEPQRKIYNQLCANIYLNEMDGKIEAHRVALGDVEEKGNLSGFNNNPLSISGDLFNYGGISLVGGGDGEEVKISTLDSFGLRPDFILMDAERYEGKILKGGEKTLKEGRPILLLEIWKEETDLVLHQLGSLGYEIHWRSDFGDNLIALHPGFRDYEESRKELESQDFRRVG